MLNEENDIELWKRALERERFARRQAEQIMEAKSLELYEKNQELQKLNQTLEQEVASRIQQVIQKEFEFKRLVETATDVIFRTDLTGNFLYINPAATVLTGYTLAETIGKSFADFVRPDFKKRLFEFYSAQIETTKEITEIEFPVIDKNGKELWFKQSATLVHENGRPKEFVVVAHNVTEVKLVQKAVAESEEKYRGMIENLNLGVIEVSSEGVIEKVYDQFCQLTGYASKELEGKKLSQLYAKSGGSIIKKTVYLEDHHQGSLKELVIVKKNGEKGYFLVSVAPFFDLQGRRVGSVLIHMDISERKLMEHKLRDSTRKMKKLNKLKERLFANISHEIRTPMNAIRGMTDLLEETKLSSEQIRYLRAMQSASNSLVILVNDMLDFSKIQSGKLIIHKEPISLLDTVNHVMLMLEKPAKDKGVKLSLVYNSKIPDFVLTNKVRIEQVLFNLVGNAIKFTPNGTVKLHVQLLKTFMDKVLVQFKIVDNGIGISQKSLNKIFNSYTQASDSTSKLFGGTGLGLTISKEIIRLLGGELNVNSVEGKGASFYFTLTLKIADSRELKQETRSSIKRFNGQKILVVEDNAVNRLIVCSHLKSWNCIYEEAENGLVALDLLRNQTFDLILMDERMPEMSGREAVKIIRNEMGVNTPIIALTANALEADKASYIKSGMNDYLAKPFNKMDLNKKLADWLFSERADSSQVDLTELKKAGDSDFVSKMINLFLEETKSEIMVVENALEEKNELPIRGFIHKLKSSITYVSNNSLYEELLTLESETDSKLFFSEFTDVLSKLKQLVNELDQIELH